MSAEEENSHYFGDLKEGSISIGGLQPERRSKEEHMASSWSVDKVVGLRVAYG